VRQASAGLFCWLCFACCRWFLLRVSGLLLVGHALQDDRRGRFFFEHSLPFRHDNAGQTVADNVDHGTRHVVECVNAEDDEDGLGWEMEGGCCCQQDDQSGTGYAGYTFAGQHERHHHQQLLAKREMHARGLGYEDAADGKIER